MNMKKVSACELKVGDNVVNIGKLTKINYEVFPSRIYYKVYGENNMYPTTFEGLEDVYVFDDKEIKEVEE